VFQLIQHICKGIKPLAPRRLRIIYILFLDIFWAGAGSCFFWFVVITKRKLKTNGYALHIKQLFFYFVYLVVFAFGLFTSWRKINCATGATMSTTDSKEKKKLKEMKRKRSNNNNNFNHRIWRCTKALGLLCGSEAFDPFRSSILQLRIIAKT